MNLYKLMNASNVVLYTTMVIVSAISLIGCIFIIIMYNKFKSLKVFAFKLVYILAIFDCITAVFSIIPTYLDNSRTNPLCTVQAFFIQFSALASILWTGVIALILYLQVIMQKNEVEKYYKVFFWAVMIMSLLCALIPVFTDDYEYIGGWCDLTYGSARGTIYRYALFYDWVWLVIVFDIYAYVCVIKRIKKEFTIRNTFIDEGRALVKRLRFYPVILVVCYTPITLTRILQTVENRFPEWVILICLVLANLMGIFNAIVYGLNETVRLEFKAWVRGVKLESEYKSTHSMSEFIY